MIGSVIVIYLLEAKMTRLEAEMTMSRIKQLVSLKVLALS